MTTVYMFYIVYIWSALHIYDPYLYKCSGQGLRVFQNWMKFLGFICTSRPFWTTLPGLLDPFGAVQMDFKANSESKWSPNAFELLSKRFPSDLQSPLDLQKSRFSTVKAKFFVRSPFVLQGATRWPKCCHLSCKYASKCPPRGGRCAHRAPFERCLSALWAV